ncbi:unnamed protein product [Cuscuta europaea]|uniref:Homeobox domain-containing protein n=1 Tax=Cuscuta europaea TaxID=41803 RepID=A0A9P0YJ31_CUSEU|nr:unnamed protein product [Cuscuta europaea]
MRPRLNKGWPSLFKVNGGCSVKRNNNPLPDKEKSSSSMVVPSRSSGRFEDIMRERWIPTPEQLKILEAVFNSGCSIPPPREDIARIRMEIEGTERQEP